MKGGLHFLVEGFQLFLCLSIMYKFRWHGLIRQVAVGVDCAVLDI